MSRPARDEEGKDRAESLASNKEDTISECPQCGTKMPGARSQFQCPVCLLREALEPVDSNSGDDADCCNVEHPGFEKVEAPARFDHYELLLNENGLPFELGRGAMGVTYKAVDTNLNCPVALKIISARNLESETARRRFVREARAAARIRHTNVASVFHLGTKGRDYFYAMEFIEGESLEQFIERHGRINVLLALDISSQVAAALCAAHKEQIVHRDIKPGNLMVRFVEDRPVLIKVIDFGLARAASGSKPESSISLPGTFAGTPLFASPEQCAGGEVDTRSDIYSLGVTLWEMLTGQVPFSGTTTEVIRQHLTAPLPLEQLGRIPKPVVVLLQSMLEKDPSRRPQDPFALQLELNAIRNALASSAQRQVTGPNGSKARRRGPLSAAMRLSPIVLGVAIIVSVLLAEIHFRDSKIPAASSGAKSIAVLPFDNESDSKENAYFSDGLTSEVIYNLSKVADLLVIARSSVLRYKETPTAPRKPLNEIGAELGVSAILESSVQRIENHVRIITILYDARTSRRLWGTSYDRATNDLFAIQSDLATQIAIALQAKLSSDERADLERKPTEDPIAYDLYLQGRFAMEIHQPKDNDKAVELFKQSLEKDPKFGLAYVGLADAYIDRVKRFQGTEFWLDAAIDLCQQAIAIDPRQLRAYTELADAFNLKGWFDRMGTPVRKALELAPNDWIANRMAAAESTQLRNEEEMYSSIRKCFMTDPYDSWAPYELALICWALGEKELAERWTASAISLESDPKRIRLMECERSVYREDYKAALTALQELPQDSKTQYSNAGDLALFCSMQAGNWTLVTQSLEAKLEVDSTNPTTLLRLALAQHALGQGAKARQTAQLVTTLAQQKLPLAKSPLWMHFDLAIASRILDRYEEAYRQLRELLSNGGFPDPVLGPKDPGFDLFKPDGEYQRILVDLNRHNEAMRAKIAEIEKGYSAGL